MLGIPIRQRKTLPVKMSRYRWASTGEWEYWTGL